MAQAQRPHRGKTVWTLGLLGVYLGFISTETGPNWRNATKRKNPGSLTAQHFAGIHGNWRNKTIIIHY